MEIFRAIIELESLAFRADRDKELQEALSKIKNALNHDATSGTIVDTNGDHVGSWRVGEVDK
jgi:hypothetical protein